MGSCIAASAGKMCLHCMKLLLVCSLPAQQACCIPRVPTHLLATSVLLFTMLDHTIVYVSMAERVLSRTTSPLSKLQLLLVLHPRLRMTCTNPMSCPHVLQCNVILFTSHIEGDVAGSLVDLEESSCTAASGGDENGTAKAVSKTVSEEHLLTGHTGAVVCLATYQDCLLLSGSTDCTVKVIIVCMQLLHLSHGSKNLVGSWTDLYFSMFSVFGGHHSVSWSWQSILKLGVVTNCK